MYNFYNSALSTFLYRSDFKLFKWVGTDFLIISEMVCTSGRKYKYSNGLESNVTYATYSCESKAISLQSGKLQSLSPTVNEIRIKT